MSHDTLDARRKRAERLRQKISELVHPDDKDESKVTDYQETGAEFVHRKMDELDHKKS